MEGGKGKSWQIRATAAADPKALTYRTKPFSILTRGGLPDDPRAEPGEDFRRRHGRRRDQLRGPPRRDLRVPRPQRGRQDDHDPDADDAAPPDQRDDHPGRPRSHNA